MPKKKSPGASHHPKYAIHFYGFGLRKPAEEYAFHPGRRWKADLVWIAERIMVEVEGGLWNYGRHNRAVSMIADMEKYNWATRMGWRVFRFTPEQVKTGEAAAFIGEVMSETKPARE